MTGLRVPPGAKQPDGPAAQRPDQPAAERPDQPATAADGRTGAAGPGPFGAMGWLRWGWRQLTSMRTALVLLFLLAVASVPGSVLPQQGIDPQSVQQYYLSHPSLAPLLARLSLFNVFAAPWFAAIYLLLFLSLAGCVIPRTFRLAGSARQQPPRAPRNLSRTPRSPRRRRCWRASGSGCAPGTAGSRRKRATCARPATCCSISPCWPCWSRSAWAVCSATRRTGFWWLASL